MNPFWRAYFSNGLKPQTSFSFNIYQGKWCNLTKFCQMGWNHQLSYDLGWRLPPPGNKNLWFLLNFGLQRTTLRRRRSFPRTKCQRDFLLKFPGVRNRKNWTAKPPLFKICLQKNSMDWFCYQPKKPDVKHYWSIIISKCCSFNVTFTHKLFFSDSKMFTTSYSFSLLPSFFSRGKSFMAMARLLHLFFVGISGAVAVKRHHEHAAALRGVGYRLGSWGIRRNHRYKWAMQQKGPWLF